MDEIDIEIEIESITSIDIEIEIEQLFSVILILKPRSWNINGDIDIVTATMEYGYSLPKRIYNFHMQHSLIPKSLLLAGREVDKQRCADTNKG